MNLHIGTKHALGFIGAMAHLLFPSTTALKMADIIRSPVYSSVVPV